MISLTIDQERIADFCRKHKIRKLALFGSVLREDFQLDSDVDVLVSFSEDAQWGLFDLIRIQEELSGILGRKVDLVDRGSVEASRNYIRRRHVLGSLKEIYVAG